MATIHGTGIQLMYADNYKRLSIPFASTCPKCGVTQPQRGFSSAALQRLLTADHPVEAYCKTCDEFWAISQRERAAIALVLNR